MDLALLALTALARGKRSSGGMDNMTLLIIIGGVLLVAIIAVVIFLVVSNKKDDDLDDDIYSDVAAQANNFGNDVMQPQFDANAMNQAANAFQQDQFENSGNGHTQIIFDSNVTQDGVIQQLAAPKTYVKLTNVQSGVVFEAELDGQISIGKRNCTINIPDDNSISGSHCQIYTHEGKFCLADSNSTNGTKLNDYRIEGPVFIEQDNILGIGRQKFKVTFEER